MMAKKNTIDLTALAAYFPPHDIEWRVGATTGDKSKGIALAYITNRAIMDRLDEVCGPANWRNEYREWHEGSQGDIAQLCGISIRVGDEWITKWDGANCTHTEPIKGGLSDAMKRAGYQWGIGRYLYKFPAQWVAIKAAGKSFRLAETPNVPGWALPGSRVQEEPATTRCEAMDPPPTETGTSPDFGENNIEPNEMTELNELGKAAYREQWNENRSKLCLWASDGRAESIDGLTVADAEKMRKHIEGTR